VRQAKTYQQRRKFSSFTENFPFPRDEKREIETAEAKKTIGEDKEIY